jgi:hypothetical protein
MGIGHGGQAYGRGDFGAHVGYDLDAAHGHAEGAQLAHQKAGVLFLDLAREHLVPDHDDGGGRRAMV